MSDQLETALHYATDNPASLKALARQEAARADQMHRLLAAVLHVTGPVSVPAASQEGGLPTIWAERAGDHIICRVEGR